MCPACIENTVVMVAGVASTGGVLAICISKFKGLFRVSCFGLLQKRKEKLRWRQLNLEINNTEKGLSR